MRKKLLVYMPPNKRTVAIETVLIEMAKHHEVLFLSLSAKGDLHTELESKGIGCYNVNIEESNPILRIWKQTCFLISFCKTYEIDVLWSHLHPCNLYAVIAQYFISAKVVIFRHHFHAQIKESGLKGLNKNEIWMERIISFLAPSIVVPSQEVYAGMIQYEHVPSDKIRIIPYIYHFENYALPDQTAIAKIKEEYSAQMLILIAMRMIKLKRHMLVLPILNELIKEGYDLQVILLDDGDERELITQYIDNNDLSTRLHLLGFRRNIIDYIQASDVVLHPSGTEASSSLIKEAGWREKVVIVNDGVGDFSEYIIDRDNGYLIPSGSQERLEYKKALINAYQNKERGMQMGTKLKSTVLEKFGVNNETVKMYLDCMQ